MLFNLIDDINILSVGITVVAIGILGMLVYFNNRESATNRAFFYFTLATIVWGISNYFNNYTFSSAILVLWILRIHLFISVWHAFAFFYLAYALPSEKITIPSWYKFILTPLVCVTAILTLTPLVFVRIDQLGAIGEVTNPIRGPGMAAFILTAFGLLGMGGYFLIRKMIKASKLEKKQLSFMILGAIITFVLILTFNVILPVMFSNLKYIPLGAVFIFPFIAFTAYAIVKYRLLNVRVIATELFIFALWITLLVITLRVSSVGDMILHLIVFVATIVLGIFLIRSVMQEVTIREKMENIAVKLEVANDELKKLDEAKSDFISIASHQLRTPLTIIKGYISMIREGTFGKISETIIDPMNKVYVSNERLINLVADLLDLSRMERGKMMYDFKEIHALDVIDGLAEDFRIVAKSKGLDFHWERPAHINDFVQADENKIRQVVLNILDNAIKYTPSGSISVSVENRGNMFIFSVTDTGAGLDTGEAATLFQKFIRGREEKKSHTEGLGLGLYVAKLIVEAHGGTLTATSPGKGKGATFSLVLPTIS